MSRTLIIIGLATRRLACCVAGLGRPAGDADRRRQARSVIENYMVMGEFDFVGICEAPDDAVMARYVLQLGGLGFVRTKTLKAFPETAYREIVRSLG
jgi:GYD domain